MSHKRLNMHSFRLLQEPMLLILAFVGLTTGTYPVLPLETPIRRCRSRQPPQEYAWQDKPVKPLVRSRTLRRLGRCGS